MRSPIGSKSYTRSGPEGVIKLGLTGRDGAAPKPHSGHGFWPPPHRGQNRVDAITNGYGTPAAQLIGHHLLRGQKSWRTLEDAQAVDVDSS